LHAAALTRHDDAVKRRLRIPAAIAFAIGTAGTAIAIAGAATSCDGKGSMPVDAQEGCMLYCIPDGTDAGVCPSPIQCSDAGACPAGCTPVG
jgi:hypothetical protein